MASTKELILYLDTLRDDISKGLTAKLRAYAYNNGWPTNLSRTLSVVKNSDETFRIGFPEELEDQILDVEMGTQNNPPNPVMRQFMNRFIMHSDDYDEQLSYLIKTWRVF